MLQTARNYYDQGCNIVPVKDKKKPLVKWTAWQNRRQTLEEFEDLPLEKADGFAIICGTKLNNGLYFGAIDIDVKKPITDETIEKGKQFETFLKKATQTEETPSHGKHYIYYSKQPIKTDNKALRFCGVEVLGTKKLCVMSPSKGYRKLNDNLPATVESLNQFYDSNLKRLGFQYRRPSVVDKRKDSATSMSAKLPLRPCIVRALELEHISHLGKVAIIAEHQKAGCQFEDVEALFHKRKGFESDEYKPELTTYQVKFCWEKGYDRFNCATLQQENLCINPEICKFRGDTFDIVQGIEGFIDADEKFNPNFFAKYLLTIQPFKTTTDNKTIFAYDPEQGIFKDNGEVVIEKAMVETLGEDTRLRYLPDIQHYIRGKTYFERIHNPLSKIAVENGILDLKTYKLEPFTPEIFLTTHIPVVYDKGASCPKIKKFLIEVVTEEQLSLIQEMFGYSLYKSMIYHKSLMLIGEGANGKSTLLELLKKFLGAENVSNATLQNLCYNRFAAAQLYGKLANICADLPDTALKATGMFKMLCGGDTITAEHKHKQLFTFKNYAKLVFSANKVPDTVDDTTAFFRRWILITCPNRFMKDNCNPKILEEISTPKEMSGLLNFALEGLKRLLKNGKFSTTEDIEELRTQYIRKSNSAKAFIEEQLIYTPDPDARIEKSKLYEIYVLFCQQNKLPSMPKRSFTLNMQQHLPQAKDTVQRVQGKLKRVWQFVKNVTVVTPSLFNHTANDVSDHSKRNNDLLGVTKSEDKTMVVECLNREPVTNVTTCPLCNGLLPKDLENTTVWEGKTVHLKPCYVDLIAGRLPHAD